MIPVWPYILPLPDVGGYSYEPQNATIRTEMEIGAKVRRRFTKHPTFISVSWRFNYSQQAFFEAWFFHELHDGSIWFQINLPTGDGLKLYNARFIGNYKVTTYSNTYWLVSARLEIEQLKIYSQEELFAQALDINELYLSIHEIVHIDYPDAVGIS